MRFFFWQKKGPAATRETPDTALQSYPYLWRISDHKRFDRNQNGLFVSPVDQEIIHLYLLQRIRWGQEHDYILSHSEIFPLGSQFFPKEPLLGQERLLRMIDASERKSRPMG
jgi:hypothetical protein